MTQGARGRAELPPAKLTRGSVMHSEEAPVYRAERSSYPVWSVDGLPRGALSLRASAMCQLIAFDAIEKLRFIHRDAKFSIEKLCFPVVAIGCPLQPATVVLNRNIV